MTWWETGPTQGFEWDFPDPLQQAGVFIVVILLYVGIPLICCYVAYKFYSKRRETSVVHEKEIHVRERVLVVCPFCSAKVEQGVSFCPNCGGTI